MPFIDLATVAEREMAPGFRPVHGQPDPRLLARAPAPSCRHAHPHEQVMAHYGAFR